MLSTTQESSIRAATAADAPMIREIMDRDWGGEPLVVRCKNFYPTQLPGFLAFDHHRLTGFLFYTLGKAEIEIIAFECYEKFRGLGTRLLDQLKVVAEAHGVRRLFLMTHNDNLDALRFYQKRGFHLCGIHLNSMEAVRKLKPAIALIGDYGIPMRDEIDLEMILSAGI